MMTFLKKYLFFDKTLLTLCIAVVLAVIFTIMSAIYAGNIESENSDLKKQLARIHSLSGEVLQLKSAVVSQEKKIGLRKSAGVVSTLEQILKSLGLQAQAIKPLQKLKVNGFTEENAELEIQKADLNGIVNLLYKIDISPLPMKVKNASIKSTFEDPDKFIIKLTVSLMSRG